MFAVLFLLTAAVLTLVQARMRIHVREDLVSTLRAESALYTQIEEARSDQAQQSAALIANQPSLKALMSTNDRLTVDDGSESLLETSHADLLVLENPSGDILAFHSKSDDVPSSVQISGRTHCDPYFPLAESTPNRRRSEHSCSEEREVRC
jgi:hypothetical protein